MKGRTLVRAARKLYDFYLEDLPTNLSLFSFLLVTFIVFVAMITFIRLYLIQLRLHLYDVETRRTD